MEKLSPAQRRKEAQRERIIAEAVRLFQERGGEAGGGFEATTIDAIAERADISVRSFFRYFDSKADVIYLDTKRALSDFRHTIVQRLAVELPLRAIANAHLELLAGFTSNPVNKSRLALALTSQNWEQRRALWNMQKHELVTETLMPYCGKDAAGCMRAAMSASLCLSAVESALEAWSNYPRSNLLRLARDATNNLGPVIDRFELQGFRKEPLKKRATG